MRSARSSTPADPGAANSTPAPIAAQQGATSRALDCASIVLALALIATDVLIQESYTRLNSPWTVPAVVGPPVAAILVWRIARRSVKSRASSVLRWLTVLTVAGVVLYYVGLAPLRVPAVPLWLTIGGVLVVVSGLAAWAQRGGREPWQRAQAALCVGYLLLAASGPLLGSWIAPDVRWPAVDDGSPVLREPARRESVIFILLDELGAAAAAPMLKSMEQASLVVSFKSIGTVGDMTAKVVPEMFVGRRFESAKPCSPTAVCDRGHSLDFARIRAAYSDIDVVGFYHPYCAMQGLRFCRRESPPNDTLAFDRWRCAAARSLGSLAGAESGHCAALPLARWRALADKINAAIHEAPFWSRGGMLFAHVPLPHPPGVTPHGSLDQHYRENLERANRLVAAIATRARVAFGERVTIVIFSDHPLRYEQACRSTIYARTSCTLQAEFKDTRVPLIVASHRIVDLSDIHDNSQVFHLLGRLGDSTHLSHAARANAIRRPRARTTKADVRRLEAPRTTDR